MSEKQLAELLQRYEHRSDEFATLVRALVSDIRAGRAYQADLEARYRRAQERFLAIENIAAGRPALASATSSRNEET